MHPAGVGSGEATLLVTSHTAGDTSQSTLRKFPVASAVASSAFCFSRPMDPYAKRRQTHLKRAGGVPSVLSAGENLAQNHWKIASYSGTIFGCSSREGPSKELFLKRMKLKELNLGKFQSFVMWKMSFQSDALLQLKFSNIIYGVDQMKSFPPGLWTNESRLFLLGRIIRDFEVLDSKKKKSSAVEELLTANFKRRVYITERKGETGQSIP